MSEFYEPDPLEYLACSDEALRTLRDELHQELIETGLRWNLVINIMHERVTHDHAQGGD